MVVKRGLKEGKDKDRGYSKHWVWHYPTFTPRISLILDILDCHSVNVYKEEAISSPFLYTRHLYFLVIRAYSMFTLSNEKVLQAHCLDSVSPGSFSHFYEFINDLLIITYIYRPRLKPQQKAADTTWSQTNHFVWSVNVPHVRSFPVEVRFFYHFIYVSSDVAKGFSS